MTKRFQTNFPPQPSNPPINERLPVELITGIFKLYIESFDLGSFEIYPNFSISQTPFFLTQICQRWRTIALNDASLWRNIKLYFKKEKYKAQLEILKGWLHSGRAKSYPLSLTVRGYPTDKSSWELKELYDLIGSPEYRERWVSLDLFCSPICTLDRILGEFPNLKALKLVPSRTHRRSYPFILEIIAPKIEEIEVHGSVRLIVQDKPFSQISKTTIVNRCMEEVLNEFQEGEASNPATTTSLQYSNFVDMTCQHVAPPPPILLPALRYLQGEFMAMNASFCKQMLDHLRSPLLKTLVLRFDKYDEPPWRSLADFMNSSSGLVHLRCFRLSAGVLDEDELIHILESMPQLEEIFLEHLGNADAPSISSKTMRILSTQEIPNEHGSRQKRNNNGGLSSTCEQCIVLPRLSTFIYKGPTSNITWSDLAGFMKARWSYRGDAGQGSNASDTDPSQRSACLRYFAFESLCDFTSQDSDARLKLLLGMNESNDFWGLDIRCKGNSVL